MLQLKNYMIKFVITSTEKNYNLLCIINGCNMLTFQDVNEEFIAKYVNAQNDLDISVEIKLVDKSRFADIFCDSVLII